MGHRGSGVSSSEKKFAENTLPSFENAFREGADFVELDVHLSADQQVVIHHDFKLDDTTNLKGCVQDFAYAQMATANATVGSGAKSVVGIPLLADVLALAAKYDRKVNVEIKVDDQGKTCKATDVVSLVKKTASVVQKAGAADRIVFSSFSFEALSEAKKLLPETPVGYLTAEGGAHLLSEADRAQKAGFEAINPIFFVLTEDPDTFHTLRTMGIQIIPWTINGAAGIRELLEGGADAIITDEVALALQVRNETPYLCHCTPVAEARDSGGCATAAPESIFPVFLTILLLALRRRRFRM
jgi:glycerophosphoryl diester phosphodiesterase